jgi:Acetyltransferase (GNAT) domain
VTASADRAAHVTPVPERDPDSFRVLHSPPTGPVEAQWRSCLCDCDFPTHYTAPEFFREPMLRKTNGFAVLSLTGERVTGILTGVRNGDHVQSGLSVRPQISFSRHADRSRAMANLVAGLVVEATSAKLVDLFVWSDMEALVEPRFRQRRHEGVVMLDLSRGPEALFQKFSENKRRNIKTAIKYGVSVAPAKSGDEISAYYRICVEWSLRKNLPIQPEEEFRHNFELTKNRLLLLARYEGKIIAGVVIRFFPRGVMEYAANSSLGSALRFRPNDLLHWRAIEWGCREGLSKYSLGGAHLFLRKFGGEIVPTTRCRLDLSMFREYTVRDWLAEKVEHGRMCLPEGLVAVGRSWRRRVGARMSFGRGST